MFNLKTLEEKWNRKGIKKVVAAAALAMMIGVNATSVGAASTAGSYKSFWLKEVSYDFNLTKDRARMSADKNTSACNMCVGMEVYKTKGKKMKKMSGVASRGIKYAISPDEGVFTKGQGIVYYYNSEDYRSATIYAN